MTVCLPENGVCPSWLFSVINIFGTVSWKTGPNHIFSSVCMSLLYSYNIKSIRVNFVIKKYSNYWFAYHSNSSA